MTQFIIKALLVVYLLVSITITFSVYVPPQDANFVSAFSLLLPLNILFGFLFLFIALFNLKDIFYKTTTAIIILTMLVNIYQVFGAGLGSKNQFDEESRFSVLSYNISMLHTRGDFSREYDNAIYNSTAASIKDYLLTHTADIICLQELWDDDSSSLFNISQSFKDNGYDHYILAEPKYIPWRKRGLGIFSKYPIINSGKIFLNPNNFNGAAYADIAIQDDTIRIINVHLQSMQIDMNRYREKPSRIPLVFYDLVRTVSQTQTIRFKQLQQMLTYAENSPYPVVIGGDFNEPRYSYLYRYINANFQNAFQQTHRLPSPTFQYKFIKVKIDHQFASDSLDIVSSKVHNQIDFTYHLPLEAEYHF